jgi:hypothetical protein
MREIDGHIKPDVVEKIVDMFYRFFNTFIADFEND